ncbi:hypothetical protein [Thioclava sp. F28-4]|uniref:hypothetical protein n=1 Tax=Thioclava sp. F28-4 TaxID=1915315 RepID=UPI00143BF4E1|nr:hypothetical protein [Thioclava sp. F28-4]
MLNLNVPESPGEPILWWLFWFTVSVVVYTVLIVWFWRALKRETRDLPDPGEPRDETSV